MTVNRNLISSTQGESLSVYSRLRRYAGHETTIAFLFILPSLIGFTVFFAIPAVRAVLISFTDWNLIRPPESVGLENYKTLINDSDFWKSLGTTALYVLYNIPLQTAIAVVIAVVMDRLHTSTWLRGLMVLPWLIPNVVTALLWLWILDPRLGIINVGLEAIGLPTQTFLGSIDQALASIAGINTWRHAGYTALLIFAGLKTIPKSLYEAAQIDGASEPRIFWSITIPLLRPVLVFVLVTSVIGSFQIFDTIAVTTQGGPVDATRVIIWYIFEFAFMRFNMGYAATLSVALFLLLVTVTIIQMRFLRADSSDLADYS